MKTSILFLFAVICSSLLAAQQIERDKVVLEIATGTWCMYCPGAAMGADDLVANGHEVAVIENHNNDSFANVYSNARNSYYAVTGYPTAKFDGIVTVVGGSQTQSMYPQYLSKYNQRKAIPSSFSIMIFGENTSLNYDVVIVANKVAAASNTNMVLHLVLTESEIPFNWFNQNHVNFVTRLMAPDQFGTSVTFASGDTEIIPLNFTLNAAWKTEHSELVAFIQDNTTKEILQGSKIALEDLQPVQMNNAAPVAIGSVANTVCENSVEPVVTITNMGIETMNSLEIHYLVNGGAAQQHNWSGALSYLQTEEVLLPAISFDLLAENLLTIYTKNPNGNPDEEPGNDTITFQFAQAGTTADRIYLMIKLDEKPEETTWEITNSNGDILRSGGPYPNQPLAFIKDTVDFDQSDCITFTIYDAGGDGLCCEHGPGFYRISDASNNLLYSGDEFTGMDMVQFHNDHISNITANNSDNNFRIYPNPFSEQTWIDLFLERPGSADIRIFSLPGETVYQKEWQGLSEGRHTLPVRLPMLNSGVYLVSVITDGNTWSSKIHITK